MNMTDNDVSDESSQAKGLKAATLWDWVKCACTVALMGAVVYKIVTIKTDVAIDYPTLLSLMLAFFSIGISAAFYFKATDSSNLFYDNTYKFTKDISELLAKIESGFGEKLRNIDVNNTRLHDKMMGELLQQATKAKELDAKEEEIEKNKSERNDLIAELTEKAKLTADEKDKYMAQFKQKEEEVLRLEAEVKKLNKNIHDTVTNHTWDEAIKNYSDSTFIRDLMSPTAGPISGARAVDLLCDISRSDKKKSNGD